MGSSSIDAVVQVAFVALHCASIAASAFSAVIFWQYERSCRYYVSRRYRQLSAVKLTSATAGTDDDGARRRDYQGNSTHRLTRVAMMCAVSMSAVSLLPVAFDMDADSRWTLAVSLAHTYCHILSHFSLLVIALNMFLLIVRHEVDAEQTYNWRRFTGILLAVPGVCTAITVVAFVLSGASFSSDTSDLVGWTWLSDYRWADVAAYAGWMSLFAVPGLLMTTLVVVQLLRHQHSRASRSSPKRVMQQSPNLKAGSSETMASQGSSRSTQSLTRIPRAVLCRAVGFLAFYLVLYGASLGAIVFCALADKSSVKRSYLFRGCAESLFGIGMFLVFGTGRATRVVVSECRQSLQSLFRRLTGGDSKAPPDAAMFSPSSVDTMQYFDRTVSERKALVKAASSMFGAMEPSKAAPSVKRNTAPAGQSPGGPNSVDATSAIPSPTRSDIINLYVGGDRASYNPYVRHSEHIKTSVPADIAQPNAISLDRNLPPRKPREAALPPHKNSMWPHYDIQPIRLSRAGVNIGRLRGSTNLFHNPFPNRAISPIGGSGSSVVEFSISDPESDE